MGLDISAYSKLVKVENPEMNKYGDPVNWDGICRIHPKTLEYTENEWEGRTKGITEGVVFEYEEYHSFRAGSYSGYNEWRDLLAKFAGWKSDQDCWNSTEGPFFELIHFSDCDGYIGPEVAAKLFKDFDDYEERAIEFSKTIYDKYGGYGEYWEYWLGKYYDWKKAFKIASDGGVVIFG
jgi:hypothetical protein